LNQKLDEAGARQAQGRRLRRRGNVARGWALVLLGGLVPLGGLGACNRDTTIVSAPPEAAAPARRPGGDAVAAGGSKGAPPEAAAAPVGSPGPSPAVGGAAAVASAPAAVPRAVPRAEAASAGAGSQAFRHSAPGRLVAIGDLHGDVAVTRAALRLAGAIDDSERWIGGDLTVVQTGDQLDRGDDERDILDLFARLAAAAPAAGGQVIALNGNHEVMNVQGDFRYVTPGAIGDFTGVRPRSPQASQAPSNFEDRAAAFFPGGAYARALSERDVVAVVGDSVFVHGGVAPAHVRFGIERINEETRQWMLGVTRGVPESVANDASPIWMRDYSLDPVSPGACQALGEVLAALGVQRMVVGHTVQKDGISSACDNRVYRIDVGLSRYYGQGPIQVLEIDENSVRVLSAPREPAGAARP
jgi:hypothetical protein